MTDIYTNYITQNAYLCTITNIGDFLTKYNFKYTIRTWL